MQNPVKFEKKGLKKKSENISDWYNDIVLRSELADYGPAKGTMVIRPYGYAIWENAQKILDTMFKTDGVENAYFPLFIPYSLFEKEKEHVKGFSPELALVTIGGGEKLPEPLAIRPTSETIMYEMYSKWIHSWRDLPMKINQWNNVVRWEKRTYLFLRTTEFLWQEGHCAHASHEESLQMVMKAVDWYKKIYEDYYAMAVVIGTKSESEKFSGAEKTFTVESLMPDGKVIQACTSHDLGQNFSRPQNISFQNKEGKSDFVWQNSWGFSTRSIGGLILTHGNDEGLVLPPKIAPIKAVIIPVLGKNEKNILEFCEEIKKEIDENTKSFPGEVRILNQVEKTFGWKANETELKGIPIAIPVGIIETSTKHISISTRLSYKTKDDSIKRRENIDIRNIGKEVNILLNNLQKHLFDESEKFLKKNTFEVDSYEEFKKIMSTTRGFIKAYWCEDPECEKKIKEETKASTRCLPLDSKDEKGKCIFCKKPAKHIWYFAQSY